MTARNCLYLLASLVAMAGPGILAFADDGVTVISTPSTAPEPANKTASSTDPTAIHKSLHKKKKPVTASTTGTATPTAVTVDPPAITPAKPQVTITSVTTTPVKPPVIAPTPTKRVPTVMSTLSQPILPARTLTRTAADPTTPIPTPSNAVIVTTPAGSPEVETGLPVARYPGINAPIRGVSTYTAIPMTLPPMPKNSAPNHPSYLASSLPVSVLPLTSSAAGSYSSPPPGAGSAGFTFVNFPKRNKTAYPWRSGIITTTFWIGEGSTPISSTTNVQSSWDEEWLSRNHGSDSPNDRNGYAAGSHASTLNPFYIALPFNDLAFPDKAHRWLPGGWYRRPVDGKQVSACKDRWVEIKNGKGDVCYAQWEDVGPLNYSDAEYVFGGERPTGLGDNHAGLDVSPAVAEYLNITDRNRLTSWRFVDAEDVRPGAWLKLDEQAVLYTALHQFKNGRAPTSELPIQRSSEPIDENQDDSNKKKVDASKG